MYSHQRIYTLLIVGIIFVCLFEVSNSIWCPECASTGTIQCNTIEDGIMQCHLTNCPLTECDADSECTLLSGFHDNGTVIESSHYAGCFPVDKNDEIYAVTECSEFIDHDYGDFSCQCAVSNCTSNFIVYPEGYKPPPKPQLPPPDKDSTNSSVSLIEVSDRIWCPECAGTGTIQCNTIQDGIMQCHLTNCPLTECDADSECTLVSGFHDNGTVIESSNFAGCFPIDNKDEIYTGNTECSEFIDHDYEDFSCICAVSNCTSNFIVYPEGYKPPPKPQPPPPDKDSTNSSDSTTISTLKISNQKVGQNISGYVIGGIVMGSLTILIILALFGIKIAQQRRRLMEDYKHGRPSSNAESTSVDITSEGSDQKIIGADTPPESPIHDYNQNMRITLDYIIGRGRYGAVWKAEWKQRDQIKDVAVKVFHSYDSTSWNVEKDLFTDASVSLAHENIVRFISAEERRQAYQRNLWIVTTFYENGSLMNYIKVNTLDWEQFCLMGLTLCRGIAHLHSDYSPNGLRKVPIAHRDLKSSNILVKPDGSCAIADFGLAVRLDPTSSTDEMANNGQVGTPRYMAPEALECKVNLRDIEAFKQMDAYSMALILWEMAMRCDVIGYAHEYQLPFGDKVSGHPSMEKMKTLVAYSRLRPPIPEQWSTVTGMKIVSATIQDGWDDDPEARLSASCVEVRFYDLSTFINGRQLVEKDETSPVTVV